MQEQATNAPDQHGWYLSTFDSRPPAGRRDAVLMAKHLDELEARFAEESTVASGARADAQRKPKHPTLEIDEYGHVVKELTRQVSVGCIERGQVLMRLWQRLHGEIKALEERESVHLQELYTARSRMAKAEQHVVQLAEERGMLKSRVASLQASSRWTSA